MIKKTISTTYPQTPVETLKLFLTKIKRHINTYQTVNASLKQELLPILGQVQDHYEQAREHDPVYNQQKLDQTIALLKNEIRYPKQTTHFSHLCQQVLSLTLEGVGKALKAKGRSFNYSSDSNDQPTIAAELLQASATLNRRSIEAEAFQIMAGPAFLPY